MTERNWPARRARMIAALEARDRRQVRRTALKSYLDALSRGAVEQYNSAYFADALEQAVREVVETLPYADGRQYLFDLAVLLKQELLVYGPCDHPVIDYEYPRAAYGQIRSLVDRVWYARSEGDGEV